MDDPESMIHDLYISIYFVCIREGIPFKYLLKSRLDEDVLPYFGVVSPTSLFVLSNLGLQERVKRGFRSLVTSYLLKTSTL